MKIRIAYELCRKMEDELWNVKLMVGIPQGIYHVDYDQKSVEFLRDEIWKADEYLEFEVEKEHLQKKENGLLSSILVACWRLPNVGRIANHLRMEYFDKEKGVENPIGGHSHKPGTREVYLSMCEPFRGEVCDFGEEHKPFFWPTFAVKHIISFR